MAFVPGHDHDVFISYAHVNDLPLRISTQPGVNQAPGWVATLVWHLKAELAQKIGRYDAFAVWLDEESLRGHHSLTDEIAARVKTSATFIAIRSPAYLASVWCRDEARLFAQQGGENLADRVFVVEKDPLDHDDAPPPELSGRRNYLFWYRLRDPSGRPQPLAYPMPPEDEIEYIRRVRTLAADIHAQLKAMGGRLYYGNDSLPGPLTGTASNDGALVPRPKSRAAGGSPPLIFLNAESHHHCMADEVRKGIGNRAIWIEPTFKGSAAQVREDFERTLSDCDAMVTIYADNESWARTQLLAAHKLAAQNPARKIPVIDAPPSDKPALGIHNLPNMDIIDARSGIGPDVLSRLQACLGL
jgi:hypothetical protein